jgi:hypothetical protein
VRSEWINDDESRLRRANQLLEIDHVVGDCESAFGVPYLEFVRVNEVESRAGCSEPRLDRVRRRVFGIQHHGRSRRPVKEVTKGELRGKRARDEGLSKPTVTDKHGQHPNRNAARK